MVDYKLNSYSLGESIYSGYKAFLTSSLINTYPDLKIVKYTALSAYPQVVFTQARIKNASTTTNNELRRKEVEFEINCYAVNKETINGLVDASEILEDIVNVSTTYLEKILGAKNVDVTSGLTNFDNKNVQSERAVIRFTMNWLQDKNIYK